MGVQRGVKNKKKKMVRMDLFRSEEMVLVQLIMPAESAHDTITYLAELSLLQFRDVSPEPQNSSPCLLHLFPISLNSSCSPPAPPRCLPIVFHATEIGQHLESSSFQSFSSSSSSSCSSDSCYKKKNISSSRSS